MDDVSKKRTAGDHWGRYGLRQAILDTLAAAGKSFKTLTLDDLAPMDQFHGGGKRMTERLAHRGGLTSGTRVLDVGGGLGGPARTLAAEFGCYVTMTDLTESYVQAAAALSTRLGLNGRLTHHVSNALELPFAEATFDVVWAQNSGMNIADKMRLYAGFRRVLRPKGRLVLQEPMAGPKQPLIFPVMWADDATASFLHPPEEMRGLIEAAGFQVRMWDDVTEEAADAGKGPDRREYSIQKLIMGDGLEAITQAGHRNHEEQRLILVQVVCERS